MRRQRTIGKKFRGPQSSIGKPKPAFSGKGSRSTRSSSEKIKMRAKNQLTPTGKERFKDGFKKYGPMTHKEVNLIFNVPEMLAITEGDSVEEVEAARLAALKKAIGNVKDDLKKFKIQIKSETVTPVTPMVGAWMALDTFDDAVAHLKGVNVQVHE